MFKCKITDFLMNSYAFIVENELFYDLSRSVVECNR